MADLQSIIKIIFSGDDQLSNTARGASKSIADFSGGVTAVLQPLANLANAILLVDAAVAAASLVIGVKAVQASSAFGAGIADLNRFMEQGEGSGAAYRKTFEDLSVQYGISINDIVSSTADWKAANYDIKTAIELTTLAMQYATAGQIEAGAATTILKSILAGMSVENDKASASATHFGDVINYIADSSSVGFNEIAEGLQKLAPSIASSGASFEQMGGIVAVVAEVLQSGSQAGTALSVVMAQLTAPSKMASDALKEFGIATDKNGIAQGTFYEILSKIGEKWPQLTDTEKASYAQRLVSAEQVKAFAALMNNWGEASTLAADATKNATGSMAKEVDRALQTSTAAFKSFDASASLLAITLGEQLEPGVVQVVRAFTEFNRELNKIGQSSANPLAPLMEMFNRFSDTLAGIIKDITKNLDEALTKVDFSKLIGAFEDLFSELGTVFSAFFGEIDLHTVDGLAAALQKLVDVGAFLVRSTQGIVEAFKPFFDAAGRMIDEFSKLDSSSQINFGQAIGGAKLLTEQGLGLGTALLAIGRAGLDMGGAMQIGFGVAKAAANALQVGFDGAVLALLKIKEAYLESKIADEDTPWGSPEKLKEYQNKLQDVKIEIEAVTTNLDKNAKEFDEGAAMIAKGTAALDANEKAFNQSKDKILAHSGAAGGSVVVLGKVNDAILGLKAGMDAANQSSVGSVVTLGKYNDAILGLKDGMEAAKKGVIVWGDSIKSFPELKLPEGVSKMVGVYQDASSSADGYKKSVEGVSTSYSQVGTATVKATGAFAAAKDTTAEAAKSLDALTKSGKLTVDQFIKVTEVANTYKVKMEEIASNERIKNIEAVVSIRTTQMETDAKRVIANFESIDKAIASTTSILGTLFSGFSSANDRVDQSKFESWINDEFKRRDALLELQKKMSEAEIERVKAQTAALERGDALIKIEGEGLKPELEAFIWKILSLIRVRANAEFSNYLLGMGVA